MPVSKPSGSRASWSGLANGTGVQGQAERAHDLARKLGQSHRLADAALSRRSRRPVAWQEGKRSCFSAPVYGTPCSLADRSSRSQFSRPSRQKAPSCPSYTSARHRNAQFQAPLMPTMVEDDLEARRSSGHTFDWANLERLDIAARTRDLLFQTDKGVCLQMRRIPGWPNWTP